MKRILIFTLSIISFSLQASIVPSLSYSSFDSSLYIEDQSTGEGETFESSGSTQLNFNLRYLMTPNWHFSLDYETLTEKYVHPVANFSDDSIGYSRTALNAHYFLFTWLELMAGYSQKSDYAAEVINATDVNYVEDSYTHFIFGFTGNFRVFGNFIFIAGYHLSPEVSSSEGFSYSESKYTFKFLYQMTSLMVGLGYTSQGRFKSTDNYDNRQVDSGIGLELSFSF
jgi:hypothetical protein